MAALTTIKIKRKAGAFVGGDLSAGELGLDTTNDVLYGSSDGSTVFTVAVGGGGGGVTVQDEGTPLATTASTLNFVGAGVEATGAGATKTITIPGGSGSTATESTEGISEWATAAETDSGWSHVGEQIVRAKLLNIKKQGGSIVVRGTSDPTSGGANTGTDSFISGRVNRSNSGNYCNISGFLNYSNSGTSCSISGANNYSNSGYGCNISGVLNYSNTGNYCNISGFYNYSNTGNYCNISGYFNHSNSGNYCSISGDNNHSNTGNYCSIFGKWNSFNTSNDAIILGARAKAHSPTMMVFAQGGYNKENGSNQTGVLIFGGEVDDPVGASLGSNVNQNELDLDIWTGKYNIPVNTTVIMNLEVMSISDFDMDIACWEYKIIFQNNGVVTEIVKIRDQNDGTTKDVATFYSGNILDETLSSSKISFDLTGNEFVLTATDTTPSRWSASIKVHELAGKSQPAYS